MQNTSNHTIDCSWRKRQKDLIASLQVQPLVVVVRPSTTQLKEASYRKTLFSLIENLSVTGIKHIEIAWLPHPSWMPLMKSLKDNFKSVSLGAASVNSVEALHSMVELQLDYGMPPQQVTQWSN